MLPPRVNPRSSINRTALQLGAAPSEFQPLADRLIDHGAGDAAALEGKAGEIGLSMKDYSVPIEPFDPVWARNRQTSLETGWWWTYAYASNWSLDAGSQGNVAVGTKVPVKYTPGVTPNRDSIILPAGTGFDRIGLVEDVKTRRCWGYWIFKELEINGLHGDNIVAGILDESGHRPFVVNGANNLWTPYDNASSVLGDRGMGTNKRMLVTTAAEVADGIIRHAGELSIAATWYCDTLPGVAGTDWFWPAERCEFDAARYALRNRDGIPLDPDRSKLIPEGLRIAFSLTKAEREAYVNSHVDPGPMREFWYAIVRQWCVFGLVVAETAGYGMRQEMTGLLGADGPTYEDRWGWSLAEVATQEYLLKDFMLDNRARAFIVRATRT